MTADNMIEIPKDLFYRMQETLERLDKFVSSELIEDIQQWGTAPEERHSFDYSDYTCVICGRDRDDPIHLHVATDEEIERSFDANR